MKWSEQYKEEIYKLKVLYELMIRILKNALGDWTYVEHMGLKANYIELRARIKNLAMEFWEEDCIDDAILLGSYFKSLPPQAYPGWPIDIDQLDPEGGHPKAIWERNQPDAEEVLQDIMLLWLKNGGQEFELSNSEQKLITKIEHNLEEQQTQKTQKIQKRVENRKEYGLDANATEKLKQKLQELQKKLDVKEDELQQIKLEPILKEKEKENFSKDLDRYVEEFTFVKNRELQRILKSNLIELKIAHTSKLHKSSVILCISIVEAILIDFLLFVYDKDKLSEVIDNPKKESWKPASSSEITGMTFYRAFKTLANSKEFDISKVLLESTQSLIDIGRQFRNAVHIHRQQQDEESFGIIDSPTANNAVTTLQLVCRDIKNWHINHPDL